MEFQITLTGADGLGLLMHNARLANPLDPAARELKKISAKRNKTDDDHMALARAEFHGGLYFDTESGAGPYIPADNIWRSLYDAAKKVKKGPKIKEGVLITTLVNPLAYAGPRGAEELWRNENFRHFSSVKVGTSRVNRCRPFFRQWSTRAVGILDPAILELEELVQVAQIAGNQIGLGDWRPKYGRFSAEVGAL